MLMRNVDKILEKTYAKIMETVDNIMKSVGNNYEKFRKQL